MSKYVALSTDATREYWELLPLVCYSWRKIGYEPFVYSVGALPPFIEKYCNTKFIRLHSVYGVKDSTVAQFSRLFMPCFFDEVATIITADADMVIAKDIFTHDGIVSYGFDLTGKSEIPICYVKAIERDWKTLMKSMDVSIDDEIAHNLPPKAYSQKWEDYWSVDQQLLTKRAREYGFDKIKFVDRGNNNKHGLPTGRWDRHDWAHIPSDIIDVHMKRNDFDAQLQVFKRLWPNDDYQFLIEFKRELDLL